MPLKVPTETSISGLFIYPVKSCRGIAVSMAHVDTYGFEGDRRFLVVTPDGAQLTQRVQPAMARIETALTSEELVLGSDGHGTVRVPRFGASTQRRTVSVWSSKGLEADDCGPEAAAWLSRALGQPVHLVRMGDAYARPILSNAARPGEQVTFADAYPVLVLSEASVSALNDRIIERGGEPVPVNRFRPNIVVAGCPPHAEDTWNRFTAGEVTFRSAGPCARCIMTTTDQLSGERGKEPLRTLATYRRDAERPSEINFAQNLIHEGSRGSVRVGDVLKIH